MYNSEMPGLKDRLSGELISEENKNEGMLYFLYGSRLGGILLFLIFKRHFFSRLAGWYLSSVFSRRHILSFVRKLQIELDEVEKPIAEFSSFNDFFVRTLKKTARPIDPDPDRLVLPADGRVQALEPFAGKFRIKGYDFKLADFLGDEQQARDYADGSMLIVRLCPADYHRFHFPCAGHILSPKIISGALYSVHPIALFRKTDIGSLNERQITVFKTRDFGQILYVEIGATVVGKIVQTHQPDSEVQKGAEKGLFLLGGSTVVLLFEPGCVKIDDDLLENTKKGLETKCLMGQSFACRREK